MLLVMTPATAEYRQQQTFNQMAYSLLALGLIGFLAMGILWIEIGKFYFKIKASNEQRTYLGYFQEYFNLSPGTVFSSEFVDFFPVSFFFHKTTRKQKLNDHVEIFFRQKMKLEIAFWLIFFTGLIMIPIIEFLIKPSQ